MTKRFKGLFTSLLMLTPLLAVPAWAVFGFSPRGKLDASDSRSMAIGAPGVGESVYCAPDDLFADLPTELGEERAFVDTSARIDRDSPASTPEIASDEPDWSPPNDALGAWKADPGQPGHSNPYNNPFLMASLDRASIPAALSSTSAELRPTQQMSPPAPVATSHAIEEPLTWRTANERLNELGIRNYKLMPGAHENEYFFWCTYTAVDNPRITHRFKAEAAEPLVAVSRVLEQIEDWNRLQAHP